MRLLRQLMFSQYKKGVDYEYDNKGRKVETPEHYTDKVVKGLKTSHLIGMGVGLGAGVGSGFGLSKLAKVVGVKNRALRHVGGTLGGIAIGAGANGITTLIGTKSHIDKEDRKLKEAGIKPISKIEHNYKKARIPKKITYVGDED